MYALEKAVWTVEQERQLWEDEQDINIHIAASIGIPSLSWHKVKPDSELWIYLKFDDYTCQKQTQKLGKIRNKVMYHTLSFASVPRNQDSISSILLNYDGSKSKSLNIGLVGKFPLMRKQFIQSIIIAWSQAPKDFTFWLQKFQFTHKQFWRIILAARHIKYILTFRCQLHDIRAIQGRMSLCKVNFIEISLASSIFISHNESIDKNDCVISIINTLMNIKQTATKSRRQIHLKINWTNLNKHKITSHINSIVNNWLKVSF